MDDAMKATNARKTSLNSYLQTQNKDSTLSYHQM